MTATQVPAGIFRAYDIRGIVGDTLDAAIVYQIGLAIGSEAAARGEQTVVVGRDGRLSGPAMSEALINGLRASGRDVIDVGMVPTPTLYFATFLLEGTQSGVMVTGSHNPPDYNGFKIVLGGETLSGDAIQALYRRIQQQDFTQGAGSLRTQAVADAYIERIVGDIQLARPLKVVVDCGNGVAGAIAPRLFEQLGCELIPLYCEVDGTFPNHHPDPGKPENLRDLIAKVRETGADIGLAFDGDGDRVGVITNSGELIYPDRLMMLFARDIIQRNPGAKIIFDVKCTGNLASQIAQWGGEPEMWRTGHSLIKARMKETGALLAGEMSGHIFFKERWYGFDDGLYGAARLLELLARGEQTADALFAEFPQDLSTPEINIQVCEDNKFTLVRQLAEQGEFGDGHKTTIDGIRVDYPDGWGLVRASNTTPVLVLRFEAKNQAALERIQAVFKEQLLNVDNTLTLPF